VSLTLVRVVEVEGVEVEEVGVGAGQPWLPVVGGEEMSCPREGSPLNPCLATAAEYKKIDHLVAS
jgi:hypothetical protein